MSLNKSQRDFFESKGLELPPSCKEKLTDDCCPIFNRNHEESRCPFFEGKKTILRESCYTNNHNKEMKDYVD